MGLDLEQLKLIVAAIAPALVLLPLLHWRGRPWPPIVSSLGIGALMGIPAYYLEGVLTAKQWDVSSMAALMVFAMVVAGMVEEGCKLAGFYLGPARTRWVQEEYDAVAFAATVSLGFATAENVGYVLEHGLATAWVRAFMAVPLHVCCGIILGYHAGRAMERRRVGWDDANLPARGLGLAIALHGFYDMLAFHDGSQFSDSLLRLVMVLAVMWSLRTCIASRRCSPSYGGMRPRIPMPLEAQRLEADTSDELPQRNPFMAGALGIAPGLGQYYNGEPRKALVFLGIALFNIALYYAAWIFVHHPDESVAWMAYFGVVPNLGAHDEKEFVQKLKELTEQRWILTPIMLTLCLFWEVVGAVEAYLTAAQRERTAQGRDLRRSFSAQGLGSSYVVHVLALLLLIFTPIIHGAAQAAGVKGSKSGSEAADAAAAAAAKAEAERAKAEAARKGGDSGMLHVTWVGEPTRIDGYDPTSAEGKTQGEGARPKSDPQASKPSDAPGAASGAARQQASQKGEKGTAPATSKAQQVAPRTPVGGKGPGMVVVEQPVQKRKGDTRGKDAARPAAAAQRDEQREKSKLADRKAPRDRMLAHGPQRPGPQRAQGKSYNEYISYQIRVNDNDGLYFRHVDPRTYTVVQYTILKDGTLEDAHLVRTSGRQEEGQLAVRVIRESAPFLPLPGDVRGVRITELFWTRQVDIPPGTIESRLSQLPDGRYIEVLH